MTDSTIYEQLVEILGTPTNESISNIYNLIACLLLILTIILFYKFISSMFNK